MFLLFAACAEPATFVSNAVVDTGELSPVGPQTDPGDCANVEAVWLRETVVARTVLPSSDGNRLVSFHDVRTSTVLELDAAGGETQRHQSSAGPGTDIARWGDTQGGGGVLAGAFSGALTLDPGRPTEARIGEVPAWGLAVVHTDADGFVTASYVEPTGAEVDFVKAVVLPDDSVVLGTLAGEEPGFGLERREGGAPVAVLARVSAEGSTIWAQAIGGTEELTLRGLAFDAGADVLTVVGQMSGRGELVIGEDEATQLRANPAGDEAWIAQLGTDGAPRWVTVVSGTAADAVAASAVGDGSVVVAGEFRGAVTVARGRGSARSMLTRSTSTDAWLARLGPDGELQWLEQSTSPGFSGLARSTHVAVVGDSVLWTGSALGTYALGEPAFVRWPQLPGSTHVFLGKLSLDGSWQCASQWLFGPLEGRRSSVDVARVVRQREGRVSMVGNATGPWTAAPGTELETRASGASSHAWEMVVSLP